ncbi:MAG: hypothetical protein KC496_07345 [Anaerolineae bacterium]|nr:hypothetical protein [Anaerolineae bacterium]
MMRQLSAYVLVMIFVMGLAACSSEPQAAPASVTPVPTATVYTRPTLPPVATPDATAQAALPTATPTITLLDPLVDVEMPPPLDISVPEGWGAAYRNLVSNEIADIGVLPFAGCGGPVTGGEARIVVLWDFASLASATSQTTSLYIDGLRLLRQHIVEPQCNISTAEERNYSVAGQAAIGTVFSAVDCPDDLPDTRGWFAGINASGVNFLFYVYTEPMTAIPGPAEDELQAILDSVVFHVEEGTTAVTVPTATPQQ